MPDAKQSQPSTQRRRSERISASVPLVVRGIDLLGQPFEEVTSTSTVNLHGCRYASKHHLPKNTWVTIELARGPKRRNVRARVAWIQRPHSIRECFQIALELQSPGNIWGVETPAEWEANMAALDASAEIPRDISEGAKVSGAEAVPADTATQGEGMATDPGYVEPVSISPESTAGLESPLLSEWRAELDRQATHAAESAAAQASEKVRAAIEEIDRLQSAASERLVSQLAQREQEALGGLKSEIEDGLRRVRETLRELDEKARGLHAESRVVLEAADRIAQVRLQVEALEAARTQQASVAPQGEIATETAMGGWRQRLESEMGVAKAQWQELLQSSLDSSIERLAERVSSRSQDVLRDADQKLSERLAELRDPLEHMSAEARTSVTSVKSALDEEVQRARTALAEIQQSAGRMKEYAAQLEAASQDTVNELHQRLENILEAQTDEIRRRAESLGADLPQRLAPMLDSLGQRLVERTVADAEEKLSTRTARIPELLRELAARELQVEESLRLHRERLRQVSENNQRETASQMAATVASLRNDFEVARKEALAKWSEELEAGGVRASHAAAESIERSSECLQQEARARMQALAEQVLAGAGAGFEEKNSEASRQFGARLEEQSAGRLAQLREHFEAAAADVGAQARTQFAEAAEAAAASFGEVVRGISGQEIGLFSESSRGVLRDREQDLTNLTQQALSSLEADASTSVAAFREQMAGQLEATISDGHKSLTDELASVLEGYRAEREAHQRDWAANIGRLSEEAAERLQERLQLASDSWMISSVRRLNENGQNVIESITRSADKALRDSCSKMFEGIAEALRGRASNTTEVVGFTPAPACDAAEAAGSHNQVGGPS